MQAWQRAEGNWREREGGSGELECISGLKQVLHCCNSYLRDGGSSRGRRTEERRWEEEEEKGFAANCC